MSLFETALIVAVRTTVFLFSSRLVEDDAETVVLDISGVFGGIATESDTQQVSITINDDDTSAFKINESGGSTTVEEDGSQDTFTVVLGSEPTSNVVFDLTASDSTEASVSKSSLTFNASNWNQAQTVTVSGVANGSQATPVSTKMSWGAIEDFGSE